jgi:beta-N-acetylhexosaminidase
VLREHIGYQGVIFSDDLEMRAVADGYGIGESACLAIAAGCDALLVCSDPERTLLAHEALTRRAESDAHFRARLRDAVARGYALRTQYPPRPSPQAQARALLEELADALRQRLTPVE